MAPIMAPGDHEGKGSNQGKYQRSQVLYDQEPGTTHWRNQQVP
jgi:hypothetical protein